APKSPASHNRRLERRAVRVVEVQRVRDERDRVSPRHVRSTALQITDAADAQSGPLGELLLSQFCQAAVAPQQLSKGGARAFAEHCHTSVSARRSITHMPS